MINFTRKERYTLSDLMNLVHQLRAPGGCPWDAAQTHASIRRNLLEEAYEVCEGIDADNPGMLQEELGDVLLQVLFHADIEAEAGRFTLEDVCDAECKKLVFRHPFLFGGEKKSWDELKQEEKGQQTLSQTMQGVAKSLPATWRTEKVLKKAVKSGQFSVSAEAASDKIKKASETLQMGLEADKTDEAILAELLFATVEACTALGLDPEELLHRKCEAFIAEFTAAEASLLLTDKIFSNDKQKGDL